MKTCRECGGKHHARGMCYSHYYRWYHANREEARRIPSSFNRKVYWKFTPYHWRRWWAQRTPDAHTLQLRAGIESLRYGLP